MRDCALAAALRVLDEKDGLFVGKYLQREGNSPRPRDGYAIVSLLLSAVIFCTSVLSSVVALFVLFIAYDGQSVGYPPDVCAMDFPAKTSDSIQVKQG